MPSTNRRPQDSASSGNRLCCRAPVVEVGSRREVVHPGFHTRWIDVSSTRRCLPFPRRPGGSAAIQRQFAVGYAVDACRRGR